MKIKILSDGTTHTTRVYAYDDDRITDITSCVRAVTWSLSANDIVATATLDVLAEVDVVGEADAPTPVCCGVTPLPEAGRGEA